MNTRQRVLRTHAASGGAGSLQRRPLDASPRPGPVGGSTAPRAPDRGAAAARRAVEEPGAAPAAAAARLEAAMEPAGAAASPPEEEPTHGWQIRHVINLHKVTIAPYCLMIFALGGLSPLGGEPASLTAAIYLALHGAYGLLWCFKDVYFGDANWKKDLDLGTGVALFLSLQLYTAAPILIARNHPATPAWLALLSVAVWGAGVFLHYGADIQKHYVLKTRREEGGGKKLITDGFFKHMRHPNYLGEVLIYAAFALLAQHPIPWAVNAFFWLGVFLPNMQKKEKSMSRYPEWDAYAARTGFLLPKLGVLTDMFPSAFVPAAGGEAAKAE